MQSVWGNKYIHQLAETKMGIDLFIKVNINATSFRSWNLTLEGLSCSRNTDKRSGKQQFIASKQERVFKAANKVERFEKKCIHY